MKKKILLDMDNTMNALWENFFLYYNDIYNQNVVVDREDLKVYGLAKNIGLEDEQGASVRAKIFSTPGFWTSIKPYDEIMKDVVEEMYNLHDVYICTTPWHDYTDCCSEKILWVKKHLPFFDIDKMIFIKRKAMIRADIIIDDAPENLEDVPFNKVIIDYPYNRDIGGLRVYNWKNISEVMKENFYL